jgi:hypothetical protein
LSPDRTAGTSDARTNPAHAALAQNLLCHLFMDGEYLSGTAPCPYSEREEMATTRDPLFDVQHPPQCALTGGT